MRVSEPVNMSGLITNSPQVQRDHGSAENNKTQKKNGVGVALADWAKQAEKSKLQHAAQLLPGGGVDCKKAIPEGNDSVTGDETDRGDRVLQGSRINFSEAAPPLALLAEEATEHIQKVVRQQSDNAEVLREKKQAEILHQRTDKSKTRKQVDREQLDRAVAQKLRDLGRERRGADFKQQDLEKRTSQEIQYAADRNRRLSVEASRIQTLRSKERNVAEVAGVIVDLAARTERRAMRNDSELASGQARKAADPRFNAHLQRRSSNSAVTRSHAESGENVRRLMLEREEESDRARLKLIEKSLRGVANILADVAAEVRLPRHLEENENPFFRLETEGVFGKKSDGQPETFAGYLQSTSSEQRPSNQPLMEETLLTDVESGIYRVSGVGNDRDTNAFLFATAESINSYRNELTVAAEKEESMQGNVSTEDEATISPAEPLNVAGLNAAASAAFAKLPDNARYSRDEEINHDEFSIEVASAGSVDGASARTGKGIPIDNSDALNEEPEPAGFLVVPGDVKTPPKKTVITAESWARPDIHFPQETRQRDVDSNTTSSEDHPVAVPPVQSHSKSADKTGFSTAAAKISASDTQPRSSKH